MPSHSTNTKKEVVEPFTRNENADLHAWLQVVLHSKEDVSNFKHVPIIADMINVHLEASETLLFGSLQTAVMDIDIEKTEFELIKKKMEHDIQAVGVYARKCRTFFC